MTHAPPLGGDFRMLLAWVVRRGKPEHVKPRTTDWAAKAADISPQHLFNLANGKRRASPVCVAKIARGWGIDAAVVSDALEITALTARPVQ